MDNQPPGAAGKSNPDGRGVVGTRHPPHPPLLLSDSPSTAVNSRSGPDDPCPELTDEGGGVSRISKGTLLRPGARHSTLSAKAFSPVVKIFDTDEAAPYERFISSISDAPGQPPDAPTRGSSPPSANLKDDRQILVKKDMKASHLCRRPRREVKEIPPTEAAYRSPSLLIVPRFRPRPVKYLFQEGDKAGTVPNATPSGEQGSSTVMAEAK